MKQTIYIILLFVFASSHGYAQTDTIKTKPAFELAKYYFVLLKHGPNRTGTDTTEINKIQAGHMANINDMAEKGYLLVAGPFGDDLGGGIFILKTETYEEAKALCDKDPAIISGRLIAEIRPWYTVTNTFTAENKLSK